jgi:hypothetical protein
MHNYLNLRGGLGNQIIQISYILSISKQLIVNVNAVTLRPQINKIDSIKYVDSKILNLVLGVIRKLVSIVAQVPTDIRIYRFYDGYFQYENNHMLIHSTVKKILIRQIYIDPKFSKIDIMIHIRGGDYTSLKSQKMYEKVSIEYYIEAMNLALKMCKKINPIILVISNELSLAEEVTQEIRSLNSGINIDHYNGDEWSDFSAIYRSDIAIIPNSTFSYVARVLNGKGKTICPDKWYKNPKIQAMRSEGFTYI